MMRIRCGDISLPLHERTIVMGILNITPDSFSDGGLYLDPSKALQHAQQLIEDGADVIDVGAESTRPGALAISAQEEMSRILPVVKGLVAEGIRQLSIDTRNAMTARACLDAGASWINDVSALSHDPNMLQEAVRADAVVLMHSGWGHFQRQQGFHYTDLLPEIAAYLKERVAYAVNHGVMKEKIIVDPGIGFAKEARHDAALLGRMQAFVGIGAGILSASSRKKFLGALTGISVEERDPLSMTAMAASVLSGADIVRMHHVKQAKLHLKLVDAIKYGS